MWKNKKLLLLLVIALLAAPNLRAQAADGVVLLEKLTSNNQVLEKTETLTDYLKFIFPLAIGLAALLALVMITIGGIEYIFSAVPGVKSEGLKRIQEAIWGLLLALAAYLILYTINPDLINLSFIIKK